MSSKASITLTDPITKKEARLDDPQAVRQLLVPLVERLGAGDGWKKRLPRNSTERVGVQILRPDVQVVMRSGRRGRVREVSAALARVEFGPGRRCEWLPVYSLEVLPR